MHTQEYSRSTNLTTACTNDCCTALETALPPSQPVLMTDAHPCIQPYPPSRLPPSDTPYSLVPINTAAITPIAHN